MGKALLLFWIEPFCQVIINNFFQPGGQWRNSLCDGLIKFWLIGGVWVVGHQVALYHGPLIFYTG